jgi:alkylhydroperoxidase family enzyme
MPDLDLVLKQLIEAVSRRDGNRLYLICRDNAQIIFEHFEAWRRVPQELLAKPEQLQEYFNALVETAQLFERSGYPELRALLTLPDEDNPMTRWKKRLAEAQQLTEAGDHEKSLAAADSLVAELQESGVSGPALVDLRARIQGLRGSVLFALDRIADARAATTCALEDCELGGDQEGVRIYRENLAILAATAETPELVNAEIEMVEAFDYAQRLTDLHRFTASSEVLARLLSTTGEAAAIVEGMRRHILGRMGFNEFRLGNRERAYALIESARELCSKSGDHYGAEIYAENLIAVSRYQSANIEA